MGSFSSLTEIFKSIYHCGFQKEVAYISGLLTTLLAKSPFHMNGGVLQNEMAIFLIYVETIQAILPLRYAI